MDHLQLIILNVTTNMSHLNFSKAQETYSAGEWCRLVSVLSLTGFEVCGQGCPWVQGHVTACHSSTAHDKEVSFFLHHVNM